MESDNMNISSMISRVENIADAAASANSFSELRSLGSQAMGTMMAIKKEFARRGISIEDEEMLGLLEKYNYGDDVETLRENLQIVLHQISGYLRGLE